MSEFKHPSDYSYQTRGCRCDGCKAVHNARVARNRADRKAAGNLSHGTRSAYDAGCRCDRCRNVRRVAYVTGAGEYKAARRQAPTPGGAGRGDLSPRLPAPPTT